MSVDVQRKLRDSYKDIMKRAKEAKQTDQKDSVQIGDPRLESMFTPEKRGRVAPFTDLMKQFKHPGEVANVHQSRLHQRKKFMGQEHQYRKANSQLQQQAKPTQPQQQQ